MAIQNPSPSANYDWRFLIRVGEHTVLLMTDSKRPAMSALKAIAPQYQRGAVLQTKNEGGWIEVEYERAGTGTTRSAPAKSPKGGRTGTKKRTATAAR